MTTVSRAKRPEGMRLSVIALVLANCIPLYGVVFQGWNIFLVIFLFWLENVVVGVFNILRIIAASPQVRYSWIGKLFMVPFFSVHYGMFCLVHGMFVVFIFGRHYFADANSLDFDMLLSLLAREPGFLYAVLALIASHGFSFVYNYIGKEEYKKASLDALMAKPYGRIVVLHLTILFGGFLVMALKAPVVGVIFLIALKVAIDLKAHLKEHRGKAAPVSEAPSSR